MQSSVLFDIIEKAYLHSLREEVEKNLKEENIEDTLLEESRQNLCSTLNEEQLKRLKYFELNLLNKMDTLHYELEEHLLNLGIQIGMELRGAFIEEI